MKVLPVQFYEDMSYFIGRMPVYKDRQALAYHWFKFYFPKHGLIFISNSYDYDDIEEKLELMYFRFRHKDIVILQTEEDWMYRFNVDQLRKRITASPFWSKKSFLLTNSYKDYKVSSKYMKAFYNPGLLDLVAYQPYDTVDTDYLKNIDNIHYHSAFLYHAERDGRDKVANILASYKKENSVVYWQKKLLVNNIKIDKETLTGRAGYNDPVDAPFLHIYNDANWAQHTAFTIALETLNNLEPNTKIRKFAPTLSEKTFKAMHLYRPALIYGGLNTREALKRMGYDTWDWIIDWSFDRETDPDLSWQMFEKEIHRIMNMDIEDIKNLMKQNKKSLLHNQKHVLKHIKTYSKGFR